MNEHYHTCEAATAHLQSVGLTFEGFNSWIIKHNKKIVITEDHELAYPAKLVRQYIKENNQL